MSREKWLGEKIPAAGMSHASHHPHFFRHRCVRHFSLHCSARIVGLPTPFFDAARRCIHVPAQRALVGFFLVLSGVCMVAQHLFRKRDVDLSFVFLQQFIPARPPGVRRTLFISRIKLWRVFLEHLRIARPVRSREHAILRPPQLVRFQPKFELRDLPCLSVAEQPVVCIASVVSIQHDLRVFVD